MIKMRRKVVKSVCIFQLLKFQMQDPGGDGNVHPILLGLKFLTKFNIFGSRDIDSLI